MKKTSSSSTAAPPPLLPPPSPMSLIVVVVVVVVAAASAVVAAPLPPLHPRFLSHLRCPHADRWLSVGPERAWIELGMRDSLDDGRERLLLSSHSQRTSEKTKTEKKTTRDLQSSMEEEEAEAAAAGGCSYTNVFSGGSTCVLYRGQSWTEADMVERCADAGSDAVFSSPAGCPADDDEASFAGWCVADVDDDRSEMTAMTISPASDCDDNDMACKTFVGGTFVPGGACSADADATATASDDGDGNLAAIMAEPIMGNCVHEYEISEGKKCFEFRGEGWTSEDMSIRCDEMSGGTLGDGGCDVGVVGSTSSLAGWCDSNSGEGRHETTMMVLTDGADCEANEMACTMLFGGTFGADGACAGSTATSSSSSSTTTTEGDDEYCLIAPGAIGAAHQAGYSRGYSFSCPDAPGRESPYMWPMSWSAEVETRSMAYGIDDVMHTSKGTTYYMLDRNWKRSDTTYRQGLLRTIGQGPCEDVDEDFAEQTGFLGCRHNDTDGTVSTMIHKGNLMYFVTWKEADVDAGEDPVLPGETDASRIEECQFMDLVVIGNIRPDWFLDKRGDDTDVQYLGNQHVYYADADDSTVPRLVKQWRKKDFASQYFTMSIMGNPPNKLRQDANASIEENMHWPLILNIPGEGFGDDMLQVYRNHRLLDAEVDAALFEIIENYEAMGGACVDRGANASDGDGAQFGPPVLEEDEKIPSNLEVDPMSWFSNEYTFSPVWDASSSTASAVDQPPSSSAATPPSSSSGGALAIEVSERLTVESCTDGLGSISVTVHFHDVEPADDGLLPWMAIGYRTGELCAMTPPDGGSTPIVLLTQTDAGSAPVAHKTLLLPEAKGASDAAFSSMMASMKNLEDEGDYSDVQVMTMSSTTAVEVSRSSGEEGTVSLYFKHTPVDAAIAGGTMYYTYAIGSTSQMGPHVTRGCFEVPPTPCGGMLEGGGEEGDADDEEENSMSDVGYMADPAPSSNDAGLARGTVFALSAIAAALIGR